MFNLKSRARQAGLTILLLGVTCLLSATSIVSAFEYDLFLYILGQQPADREVIAIKSIRDAPQWSIVFVYALIFAIYVHRYARSRTTVASILTVALILFGLLMLEILLAVFLMLFLPLVFPALVMLVVSSISWMVGLYQGFVTTVQAQNGSITLDDVRLHIENGDLISALTLLKLCPYSDDLLEVGYELGMLLESGKQWASALNLYHWLSGLDPGLSDFVSRIEEIRKNHTLQPRLEKPVSLSGPELPEIGHYRLIKQIAKGATSIMYEATDKRNHNHVALKVMSIRQSEKAEQDHIVHWLREAEIVAQLDHANIVKIYDAELQGDNAYIAMDYIPGYSMSLRLRKREYLTVGECIRVSKAMLRALVVAHGHGVVHGDIKPANIMHDSVKDSYILTDFGAAYSDSRERRGKKVIVGTPAYMSPEQIEGKRLDGRSDLYSLGVTLYHLLTGHQPFEGSNLPELKRNIVSNAPGLDHLSLPAGIAEVIAKALEKKAFMRFADAQQMLTSIEHCEKQLRDRMDRQD